MHRSRSDKSRYRWALVGVIFFVLQQQFTAAGESVTLTAATPVLGVSRTWPSDLLLSSPLPLQGFQVLQVLFSRPVLDPRAGASGGGLHNSSSAPPANGTTCADKVPFRLWCATSPVPAALSCRWLNASMARLAPVQRWPPDLDCTLTLSSNLTTYDGVKLSPALAAPIPLRSPPLQWQAGPVTSGTVRYKTGDGRMWQRSAGGAGLEVPPDGLVTLNFTHPVSVPALTKALRVVGHPGQFTITFYACRQPWEMASPPQRLTSQEVSCVALHIWPPLANFTSYQVALPLGTRYSGTAGKLSATLTLNVSGLHGFAIPLASDWTAPSQSLQRVRLWLPRGLAPSVTATQLMAQVSVHLDTARGPPHCPQGEVHVESGSLIREGPRNRTTHLELILTHVCAERFYRFSVAGSLAVRDALGMPLEASEGLAWSARPTGADQPLLPINRPVVHMLPEGFPRTWPLVVPPQAPATTVSTWALSSQDASRLEQLALLTAFLQPSFLGGGAQVPEWQGIRLSTLGTPDSTATSQFNGSVPTMMNVSLLPGPNSTLRLQDADIHVVAVTDAQPPIVQVVLRTRLVSTWTMSVGGAGVQLTVQVTSADASRPGPVQGAEALAYAVQDPYWEYTDANPDPPGTAHVLLGRCLTSAAAGSCAISVDASNWTALPRQLRVVGLVRHQDPVWGVACTPDVSSPDLQRYIAAPISGTPLDYYDETPWQWDPSTLFMNNWALRPRPYVGALVVHEEVVRPGGLLHVTGYLARNARWPLAGGAGAEGDQGGSARLVAPNITEALLAVYPAWPNWAGTFELVDTTSSNASATTTATATTSSNAFATATATTSSSNATVTATATRTTTATSTTTKGTRGPAASTFSSSSPSEGWGVENTRRRLLSRHLLTSKRSAVLAGGKRRASGSGGSGSGGGAAGSDGPGAATLFMGAGRASSTTSGAASAGGGGRSGDKARHRARAAARGRPWAGTGTRAHRGAGGSGAVKAADANGGGVGGRGGKGGKRGLLSGPTIFAPTILRVPVDPETGSFHATIKVPAGAQPQGAFRWTQLPASYWSHCHVHLLVGSNGVLPPPEEDWDVSNIVYAYPDPVRAAPDADHHQWVAYRRFDVAEDQWVSDLTQEVHTRPDSATQVSAVVSSSWGPTPHALVRFNWTTTDEQGTYTFASGSALLDTGADGRATLNLPRNATSPGPVLRVSAVRYLPAMYASQLQRYMKTTTIRLESSPYRVEVIRSPPTHLPGVPFAVRAVLRHSLNGSEVQGALMLATLYPTGPSKRSESCKAPLTAGPCFVGNRATPGRHPCDLALPCVGRYTLRVCTAPPSMQPADLPFLPGPPTCTSVAVGRTEEEWAAAPLSTPWGIDSDIEVSDLPLLWADQSDYTVGSTAELHFLNPFHAWSDNVTAAGAWSGNASAVVTWSGSHSSAWRTLLVPQADLQQAVVRVRVVLGRDCLGDCTVLLVMTGVALPWPSAGPSAGQLPPGVAKSVAYDSTLPVSVTSRLVLRVGPEQLPVQVGTPSTSQPSSTQPSSTQPSSSPASSTCVAAALVEVKAGGQLRVCGSVPLGQQRNTTTTADMTIVAGPRSSLQLAATSPPDPASGPPTTLQMDPPTASHVAHMAHTLTSSGVVMAVAGQQLQRLRLAGGSAVNGATLAFPAPSSLTQWPGQELSPTSLVSLPDQQWLGQLVASTITDTPPPTPWQQQDPFAPLADGEVVSQEGPSYATLDPMEGEVVPGGPDPVQAERHLGTLYHQQRLPTPAGAGSSSPPVRFTGGVSAVVATWGVPANTTTGASAVARAYVVARDANGNLAVGVSGGMGVHVT